MRVRDADRRRRLRIRTHCPRVLAGPIPEERFTMRYLTSLAAIAACAAFLVAPLSAVAQQKSEITITRQPGILYLPSHVMEKQRLIEQEAARRGVPNLQVKWVNLSGGGAQTDALLSGSVDAVNTGVGNLLLLWDRTKGGVKGIVANSALPLTLIT